MDFMKVLDQTVREIKREVTLKVLKVPEIEQKVLDATSDEPRGPHGSDLADIARATKSYSDCAMIMNVLWQRLGATGANWRHVYKTLSVIEYLLANGTERAVDDIIDNSSQIAKLVNFEYVEPRKDAGLNVRKKAENVLAIVDDREKLQQVREKAAVTRDKYFGLSSTGVTYKSGSGSYSAGSRYGMTRSSKEADTYRGSHRGKEWSNSSKETIPDFTKSRQMSIGNTRSTTNHKSTKGEGHRGRNQNSLTSQLKLSSNIRSTSGDTNSQKVDNEDDFNPRGSSTSGTATASYNHVDLFGQSLMDDLVDTTESTSRVLPNIGIASLPEVDLFANTDFQSANAQLESATGSHAKISTQEDIDLFVGRSPFAGSVNSDTEFSVRGSPNKSSEQNVASLTHSCATAFDSFQPSFVASFPSDIEFSVRDTPSSGQTKMESVKGSDNSPLEELNFGAFTSPTASTTKPMSKSPTKQGLASMSEPKPDMKKGAFQVKSSIWADSLSRGLIFESLYAAKKVDLSDVEVVGQSSDVSEDKGPAVPWFRGMTMDTGSGLQLQSMSGFPSSAGSMSGSGNFQQQQFGSFK
ncbi:hypothetical protein HU200_037268 [Digitaria exilis]|uniref:ENTH domain-containing protein n=1 Tax=Digitaria exilis TaxID=1010633 RepID=A0A835BFA8_9POAL|nr:hypothetical protein HU200_037268 [Digitaria exilis]